MIEPDFPAPPPAAPAKRRFSPLLALFLVVLVAGALLAGFGLVQVLSYRTIAVPGGSMGPTVPAGTSVVYRLREGEEIRRGDLVVFEADQFTGRPGVRLVKRVIAVGGDTVECCDAQQRIEENGKPVAEPYLDPAVPPERGALRFKATVPAGSVFVAGDTRDNSNDSRMYTDQFGGGAVPLSKVDGVIVAKGSLFWSETLKPTTAFTDAGLPGAATEDSGPVTARLTFAGGVLLFLIGFAGAIVTAARSARKRRIAAAPPAY
ncbi:MAG TPA: signal peptidase I [Amycolatopsis sp.]